MSRIGKQPVIIPSGVQADVSSDRVSVKGPKGTLMLALHPHVTLTKEGDNLMVTVTDPENRSDRALWGLFQRLVNNMVVGVTSGFERKLEVNGVGYKVAVAGNALALSLGYSHPINFPLPAGIEAKVEKNIITLNGIDKQLLGETAAGIRKLRKPEPYKGKGIKYVEEVIRRKAGKAAKAAGSK